MSDPFPAFENFAPPVNPLTNFGAQTPAEPKKRGPRRQPKAEAPVKAKRIGRPPKAKEAPAPAPQPAGDLDFRRLTVSLAGLRSEDIKPLVTAYEALMVLPAEDRTRVMGMLNKVLA